MNPHPERLDPDFKRVWAATTVSLFGDAVTTLALPLAAAITLHASPFQMGLLTTAGMLPHLLLYLPAGVWVDRRRRQPVMVGADLARAALIAAVPVFALAHALRVELLYVVAFAAGVFKVFFDLAYAARVQALVPADLRPAANSRLSVSRSVSFVGGPALAGALVQLITAPFALILDAGSFLASAGLVWSVRAPEARPHAERPGVWQELGAGIRLTFGHPVLRPMYLCTSTMNFFNFAFGAVAILYLVSGLHLSAAAIGAALGVSGVGAIAGSLVAARVARRFGTGPALIAGELLFTAGFLAIPLASGPPALAAIVISTGYLVTGVGLMLLDTTASTLFQNVVPPDLMGRANAAGRQLNFGLRPVGAFTGGVLGQELGLHAAVWIGAVGALLAAATMLVTRVRTYR